MKCNETIRLDSIEQARRSAPDEHAPKCEDVKLLLHLQKIQLNENALPWKRESSIEILVQNLIIAKVV